MCFAAHGAKKAAKGPPHVLLAFSSMEDAFQGDTYFTIMQKPYYLLYIYIPILATTIIWIYYVHTIGSPDLRVLT